MNARELRVAMLAQCYRDGIPPFRKITEGGGLRDIPQLEGIEDRGGLDDDPFPEGQVDRSVMGRIVPTTGQWSGIVPPDDGE
jgi:hypothetical protein